MLGEGVIFVSSDTLRSLISSKKTSMPRVDPVPSSSASSPNVLPTPVGALPPLLPKASLVPCMVVVSRMQVFSNWARRAA